MKTVGKILIPRYSAFLGRTFEGSKTLPSRVLTFSLYSVTRLSRLLATIKHVSL